MRISRIIKNTLKIWKHGGVTNLTLSKIQYGELFKGKHIIITGGSEGIGLAMAKKFIEGGGSVLITGRSIEKLVTAMDSISSDRLYIYQWDISDTDNLKYHFDNAISLLGGLDVFINNAALIPSKSDEFDYDKIMTTNAKAVYLICGMVVNYFINHVQGGKILNISSLNAYQNSTRPYFISKSTVNAITKGFAKKYAHKNIIINGIAPGFCASSINYQDVSKNAFDSKSLIKRIITPEEIAELAYFLCSDAANGIVGQIIVVDGGVTL